MFAGKIRTKIDRKHVQYNNSAGTEKPFNVTATRRMNKYGDEQIRGQAQGPTNKKPVVNIYTYIYIYIDIYRYIQLSDCCRRRYRSTEVVVIYFAG